MKQNRANIFRQNLYRITYLIVIFFLISPLGNIALARDNGKSLKDIKEFHRRDGLVNVFHKIKNNRQVRIAYLGGSITAAESGWRELTFDWFRLNFPQTAFYQTDAGIGGTGSDLGVFRVEKDVLAYNPDLIFVEFAVNDGSKAREDILKYMEGIIRKCWKQDPNIDLCFVYTGIDKHIQKLVQGKLHTSVLAMEELADYYGIPSIHMGVEVARLYGQNKLVLTGSPDENQQTIVFTKDHVHPLAESGHPLYAATVVRYLEKMKRTKGIQPHVLKEPYVENNWEEAKMMNLSSAKKTGNWELIPAEHEFAKEFSKFMPQIYKGTPGSKLEFSFNGPYLALYDIIGPGTGILRVSIDGKEQEVERFDGYCTYYRLGRKVIANDLGEGTHTAEITVLDKAIDKEGMLREDRVAEYYEHPEKYNETNWYIGYILVLE